MVGKRVSRGGVIFGTFLGPILEGFRCFYVGFRRFFASTFDLLAGAPLEPILGLIWGSFWSDFWSILGVAGGTFTTKSARVKN